MTIDQHAGLIVEALDRLDTIVLVLGPPDRGAGLPTISAASSAFRRLANWNSPDGAAKVGLAALVVPETNRPTLDALAAAAANGTKLAGEILLGQASARFWLGFQLTTVSTPRSGATCVLIGRDITEQMRRSGDDRATQRLLTSAFMSVDAAAVVVTAGERILTCSQAFASLCGRPAKELAVTGLATVLDGVVRRALQGALKQAIPGSPPRTVKGAALKQDGTTMAATFTLAAIEGRAGQRMCVVTMHPEPLVAEGAAKASRESDTVGAIRLLGLEQVKATLGDQWPALADRAMQLAEVTIRRRLGAQDIVSRTSDQEFLIWFASGTSEENELVVARIAREVRIVLLTKFTDSLVSSVASAAVTLPGGSNPGDLPEAARNELNSHPSLAPDPAMEAARAYLAWAEEELPIEADQMFGRGGQVVPAVWCSLPATVASRLEQATTTLKGETLGAFELDILRLRAGVALVAKAAERKQPKSCFVAVPHGCLASPRARAAITEILGMIDAAATGRLALLIEGPFTGLSTERLIELAAPLRGKVRALGLSAVSLQDLPLAAIRQPFTMIAFPSGPLKGAGIEDQLWQAITVVHRAGAKVIARDIATANEARMLLELGVDFVCGTAPAAALS